MRLTVLILSLIVPFGLTPGRAEVKTGNGTQNLQAQALRVFLDGRYIEWDYIRTQIPFVNYVRDRTDADVHERPWTKSFSCARTRRRRILTGSMSG